MTENLHGHFAIHPTQVLTFPTAREWGSGLLRFQPEERTALRTRQVPFSMGKAKKTEESGVSSISYTKFSSFIEFLLLVYLTNCYQFPESSEQQPVCQAACELSQIILQGCCSSSNLRKQFVQFVLTLELTCICCQSVALAALCVEKSRKYTACLKDR